VVAVPTITLALGTDLTGTDAIIATALTDGQVLTMTGANDAMVSIGAGDLTATGYLGVLTITDGTADQTITGGSAQDVISLANGGNDTVVFGTAFAAGNASADTISFFTVNADLFDVGFNLFNGTTALTSTLVGIAPEAVADNGSATADDVIYTFAGLDDVLAAGTTIANAVANAVTALTSGVDFADANVVAGDSFLLQMNDGADTFLFHYLADAAPAVTTAADLELIAIFEDTVTAFQTGAVI
jgi:hypothetical protein